VFDAGQETATEQKDFLDFIAKEDIRLKHLLLTHSHLDHVLGLVFMYEKYKLVPKMSEEDYATLLLVPQYSAMFNQTFELPPHYPKPIFIKEGDEFSIGEDIVFSTLFVPGHAPGHLAFVNHPDKYILSGDVVFRNSVGRTDLPGSSLETLTQSIQEKIYTLPDDYTIYSGHGSTTTVGQEKNNNPFIRGKK
jgi:glyoxylase-like metal-dependent hydrolase (beta-lactamase superfamily II)